MSQRNKLLLALTGILCLAFIGVSVVNYLITRTSVHREILQNDLPLTMNNIYSDLTAELNRPIVVASSMAADTFLKDWVMDGEQDITKVKKYLLEIKEKYGYFSTFFISSHTSIYYHFKGVHKRITPEDDHDIWYYRFIGSEKEYELDVDTDEASGNVLTIFVNYRVEDEEGRLLGVTGVGLKVDTISYLVTKYKKQFQRDVYLTDTSGLVQVHQDPANIHVLSLNQIEGLRRYMSEILSKSETPSHFEYLNEGERILLNVRYIPSLDWLLFVEQSETEALTNARMNFLRTVGLGLVSSIAVITLTLVTINRYQNQLESIAVTDALTGAVNRRKLDEEFERAVYSYSRSQQDFCVILIDLDKFKQVNDTMGHIFGDSVLQSVSKIMTQIIRSCDILARWGGDEFVILSASSLENSVLMAERIRESIEKTDWKRQLVQSFGDEFGITVSCGVTQYLEGDTLDTILARADQALYRSKDQGGNVVDTQK